MQQHEFISIRGISKHFGEVRAVDDVHLEIQKGEFFALLGPSGCGKTTLLRMLAGFETPTSGEIYIDDEATAAVPHYRRPVNMVFQNYAIFPHLNVFQNIAFGLRKDRLAKPALEQKVNDMLALIKLDGYGTRRADELSGGQRQRVALARALVKKPKVLLLDEPLGALDKKLRERMQLELRELQRNVGITFVFVTHDQEEALTMSDRIAVMSQGKVLEHGPPSGLYERPSTSFVAEFLGTMNFFEGVINERTDATVTVSTDRLGVIKAVSSPQFDVGERITVALRPENIRMGPRTRETGTGTVDGVLSATAYLGDRSHLYVRLDGSEEPVLVARQNMDGSGDVSSDGETAVSLWWPETSVLLLKSE